MTTETVPGHRAVEALGLVEGNTTVAKHVGRGFMAGLKNIVGGELTQYAELLADARAQAIARMTSHAERLGANAIVAVRFTTSSVADSAAELYGNRTAVSIE